MSSEQLYSSGMTAYWFQKWLPLSLPPDPLAGQLKCEPWSGFGVISPTQ